MPTRLEVYNAIDTERDYQDRLPTTRSTHPVRPRTDGQPHTVGDYCTMLRYYAGQLDEAWTMNAGDAEALEVMRKIAGIAVHCMEDHGAPRRQ